jgi:hypothetical protein
MRGWMMGLDRWDAFFCSIVFFVNFFATVSRGGEADTGFVNGSVGVFIYLCIILVVNSVLRWRNGRDV